MRIILNIIIKEFLQLKRDPRLFAIIFIAPVMQLILLGYAANLEKIPSFSLAGFIFLNSSSIAFLLFLKVASS